VDNTKGVLCAAFAESTNVGVVAMKKLIVIIAGLLGAIVAGGANFSP
jgi:hypothetical protein